jgi:hypothetical protein|tara:strand:+ start:1344 stop:2180 length:837 start_codon:yes stop_codon:yes gene_type:complete
MYGQDIYYLPRTIVTRDMVLNEDVESQFDDAYMVEVYIEGIEGFEGEGNLMSKFGLEIRDEATFIVARRRWDQMVGSFENTEFQQRPNEGDLIYLPLSNSFFEISFVEHEMPFYQLSNLPVYKMQARLFEMNDEDFNTGIDEIDAVETNSYTTLFELGVITGEFVDGETITQTLQASPLITISAEVLYVKNDTREMKVIDIETNDGLFHSFIPGGIGINEIIGSDSGATANIETVFDITSTEDGVFPNSAEAQNFTFENEGDSIIDFSESNPFSERSV